MSDLKTLDAQIAELTAKRDGLIKEQKAGAINSIRETILQFGLTAEDIFSAKGRGGSQSKGVKVAPKYRDPKTGATWSGRGKAPTWIASAANRNEYLIGGQAA